MNPRSLRSDLALDALGNEVRREMISILRKGPIPVGELAEHFDISRPAISKHLRLMEDAGLVVRKTQGRHNVCELGSVGFESVRRYLDSFWDDALPRFKMVAENTKGRRRE